jgi:hypothetical protein
MSPERRLTVPKVLLDDAEVAAFHIVLLWEEHESAELCARAMAALSTRFPVRRHLDFGASDTMARRHEAQHGRCYWNSHRAVTEDPDLRTAWYVEGVCGWLTSPFAMMCQGWLETADGRVIDPTWPVMVKPGDVERFARSSFHIPVVRFRPAEVVGCLLPRTVFQHDLVLRTLQTVTGIIDVLMGVLGPDRGRLRRPYMEDAFQARAERFRRTGSWVDRGTVIVPTDSCASP